MNKSVVAIMPCLGRLERTLSLVQRLRANASLDPWELVLVTDNDAALATALRATGERVINLTGARGYWHALRVGCEQTESALVVNLANDLLPGLLWLGRGVTAYRTRFGSHDGVMGFNDGVHTGAHAAHFIVGRALLREWYGADYWPLMYQHNFGDTEICQRAQQVGRFAVAPWAVLYHDHPVSGGASDAVYDRGRATWNADQALFEQRRAQWKS